MSDSADEVVERLADLRQKLWEAEMTNRVDLSPEELIERLLSALRHGDALPGGLVVVTERTLRFALYMFEPNETSGDHGIKNERSIAKLRAMLSEGRDG